MKRLLTAGLALLVVSALGLGIAHSAWAQEPEEEATAETSVPAGRPLGMRGAGEAVMEAIEETLGLTRDEIRTMREDGQTLAEIAKEQKVDQEDLAEAILEAKTEQIEQAVTDEEITREQADWLIARDKAMVEFELTDPFPGGFGMGPGGERGHGHGHGMRGGPEGFGPRGMQGQGPASAPTETESES
ncbi:MAG: hypothetical protein ACOX2L_06315 [Anaerolineae bacterium]|jgi:hypothetical protein|nr:DUF1002 domain-containing protein [Chloroflexota bacterium]